ncbi:MAG: DUF3987 domain-containing protein [Acidobacteriota bacterium]|nr:DUF3987 domain-containing protein [Acidobacteriota bacterium]
MGEALPEKFDTSDYFTSGGTADRLQAVFAARSNKNDSELLAAAIPADGWLADWMAYARPFSESPDAFNLMGGLIALAATIGRRACIDHGDEWLHPNLFVCIVAEQARLRKSTSLGTVRRLLSSAFPAGEDEQGIIQPDDFSDEGLADALQENPCGLFVWSEFGLVLGTTQKSYSATSRQFLADLFDCPDHRSRRLRRETVRLEFPGPSIITASTFSWLAERVREADVLGGFLSRFLYVVGGEKSKVLPFRPRADRDLRDNLQWRLQELRRGLEGGHCLGIDGIRDVYADFYDRYEGNQAPDIDERFAGFYSRLCVYALKLTMLYQLSADPDSRELTLPAWEQAKALVELLRRGMCRIIGELSDSDEWAKAQRVSRLVTRAGPEGILRRDLHQRSHLTAKELDEVLRTLTEAELIAEDPANPKRFKSITGAVC